MLHTHTHTSAHSPCGWIVGGIIAVGVPPQSGYWAAGGGGEPPTHALGTAKGVPEGLAGLEGKAIQAGGVAHVAPRPKAPVVPGIAAGDFIRACIEPRVAVGAAEGDGGARGVTLGVLR